MLPYFSAERALLWCKRSLMKFIIAHQITKIEDNFQFSELHSHSASSMPAKGFFINIHFLCTKCEWWLHLTCCFLVVSLFLFTFFLCWHDVCNLLSLQRSGTDSAI